MVCLVYVKAQYVDNAEASLLAQQSPQIPSNLTGTQLVHLVTKC